MFSKPQRSEIDHHTGKLIVGAIALSLANMTSFLSGDVAIQSISESYRVGGWARDVFVGSLFAITAFLLAYNGYTRRQMLLSKTAAIAALGVALFPCECRVYDEIIPGVHGASAALMFIILALFCFTFYRRARGKTYPQARFRAWLYVACGATILACIAVIGIDYLTGHALRASFERLEFYGEKIGLHAFGIAWLAASRILPFITHADERINPFK